MRRELPWLETKHWRRVSVKGVEECGRTRGEVEECVVCVWYVCVYVCVCVCATVLRLEGVGWRKRGLR